MDIETIVAGHYAHGRLEAAILAGLAAAGKDPARLTVDDLAPVDEFHIGGRQATEELAAGLPLAPGLKLLDIGSGLGGAARFLAARHGCDVTGIDLTAEYVAVANTLAARVGLADRVRYVQGSALSLPFPGGSFDGATMLHVGMNVADKAALFRSVRRVLKPGGFFAIYDIMAEAAGELTYPLPWATTAAASFVEPASAYRARLAEAGFEVAPARSRRDLADAFFARMRAAAQGGPPPLGLHLVMGEATRVKVANMIGGVEGGMIVPTEIIARAV
jgi:ubiquinone/menaquinone biosynthesis C-methylase UbiE